MENKCPKCEISLDNEYENIKIKDNNKLALKLLFGEISQNINTIKNLGYCDCCGASKKEIILDRI